MPNNHTEPDISEEQGRGWLQSPKPVALQPVTPQGDATSPSGDSEWQWINQQPPPPPPPLTIHAARRRIPRRVWIGLGTTLSVAAVLVGTAINSITNQPETITAIPTLTAGPPTTTAPASTACAGLSGQAVTDTAGGNDSLTGVIAAFEHAYYVQRSAEAALRLVAPQAGLAPEALAAGIASVPTGTTHCVAITAITDDTADVHLVERHPDGARTDYLQLVNVRHEAGAVVITNIQKRG
ncbi:hypothetical protein OHB12_04685 [Nocardia sp. NBC_01730]|uniref:hypothetical protein n=1 Tax=Nocardia sp. NBC_01730 TaxID=2975998 RepID=UPI002E11DFEC|nr:hypothetical protein OHB12_04685 [Nocardia sp. NBC_01730]